MLQQLEQDLIGRATATNRVTELSAPGQSLHWSRVDTRSVFWLVVGTWSAATQDTQACKLCDIEHLKPWQGPGMCEVCSERVLPTKNAFWVSPTLSNRSCVWECRPDLTHLDPQRYSLDVNSLWWAQGLSLGLALESRFKPNWCVPCAQKPIGPLVPVNGPGWRENFAAKSPCSKGEFWQSSCSTTRDPGCSTCSQPTSNSVLYTPLAPFATVPKSSKMVLTEDWESEKCANVCKIGFFDSRFKFGYYDKFKASDLFTVALDGDAGPVYQVYVGLSSQDDNINSKFSQDDENPTCEPCPNLPEKLPFESWSKCELPGGINGPIDALREPCELGVGVSDTVKASDL